MEESTKSIICTIFILRAKATRDESSILRWFFARANDTYSVTN